MIQYDDIQQEDMGRYWGEGYVFLNHNGSWNAYKLNQVLEDSVRLVLDAKIGPYGNPPERLSMTYADFFAQAMLHRPPLGILVRDTGEVWGLSWQHANGQELAKAIRAPDVYVKPLVGAGDVEVQQAPDNEWHELFVGRIADLRRILLNHLPADIDLQEIRLDPQVAVAVHLYSHHRLVIGVPGKRRQEGQHQNAIVLVMEFLNQVKRNISTAIKAVAQKPVSLEGTAWLRPDKDVVWLMNGAYEVGQIDRTYGRFIPLATPGARRLVGQTTYELLI
jgi:hypothetical protein